MRWRRGGSGGGFRLWVDRPAEAGKRVILESFWSKGAGALGGGTGAAAVPGPRPGGAWPWGFCVYPAERAGPGGAGFGVGR